VRARCFFAVRKISDRLSLTSIMLARCTAQNYPREWRDDTFIQLYAYRCASVHVCVCVCVCARARARVCRRTGLTARSDRFFIFVSQTIMIARRQDLFFPFSLLFVSSRWLLLSTVISLRLHPQWRSSVRSFSETNAGRNDSSHVSRNQ